MAYSTEIGYTGDGSTTDYLITFPFLDKEDIKAKVDGTDVTTFAVNGTTLAFTSAPANTKPIVIYRDTGIDKANVTFQAGSSIRASDLNSNDTQLLYAIQENESNTGTTADLATGQKGHINVNTANNWLINDNVITNAMLNNDIVDSAEIADGAVDLDHMSSQSVDEDNLLIDNAGSNGQWLQKQSGGTGGMIWATITPYTHPNHSGEVTSTADGATVIASNIVDEDNLKISNAGTNGDYLTKQSGDTGGLTWFTPNLGKIITFATANTTTNVTGSEDTWVDTGLTVNITPKSTSSTIIVTSYIHMYGSCKASSSGTHSGKFRLRLRVQPSGGSEATVGSEMWGIFGKGVDSTYIHYGTQKRWQFVFHEEFANSTTTLKTFHVECEEQDETVLSVNDENGRSYINAMEIV